MRFKTLKTSQTGLKFKELQKRVDHCVAAQERLAEKLGFQQYKKVYNSAWGGISCVIFTKKDSVPNPRLWKKRHYGVFPKKNTYAGRKLAKQFEDLPIIYTHELNNCVGFDGAPFKSIGCCFNHPEWMLFSLEDDWTFTIPEDCIEITTTEYKDLSKK